MPSLEYVVRPFSTPNTQGAVIIPSTPTGSRERATLTWGAKATMPSQASGINFTVVCCQEDLEEQSRTSETKRIYQDGDSSSDNYVDVERPLTLKLNKKDKNSCGDDWDQISGVAAAVDSSLAEFAAGFAPWGGSTGQQQCNTGWKFKNQSTAGSS